MVYLCTHNNPIFCLTFDTLQASPSDPENFPFVLLGNKVDVDGGNSRVVNTTTHFVPRINSSLELD